MRDGWLGRFFKRSALTDRLEALEQSAVRLAREQAKANPEWEAANQTCRQLAGELSRALGRLEEALQRHYQLEAGLKEEGYRQGRREVLDEAVQGIITLLDGLHRAILTAQRAGTAGAPWLAGLEALQRQGEETLGGWGIQPASAPGMPFDPQRHEAVAVVEGSSPGEPVIAEEVARGYQSDGQVLRFARVVVARYEGDHRHRPGDDQLGGGSDGARQRFTLGPRSYTPEEISALILLKMKAIAEASLGGPVERAVITMPAYFSDAQRQATKTAGEIAGLQVVRIINEPTAAALACTAGRDVSEKVLVYDLGGGTLDVSVVQIEAGVVEVLATAGNNRLGGDDFDRRIVDHVAEYFAREHGVDLRQDPRTHARLLQAAEQAKIALSDRPFAAVQESFVAEKDGAPLHLDFELSRERFEHLIADLLDVSIELIDRALADANLRPEDLDRVLLVGGSTRIPAVRRQLEEHLGMEPTGHIHPDECVALGTAVQVAIIEGQAVDTILVDVTAHSLGISAAQFIGRELVPDRFSVVIPRNTVVPASKAELCTTVVDGQESVKIEVYQGESPDARANVFLGEFELRGLPRSARAGEPQIVVSFDYDVNGIVHVRAEERKSRRRGSIEIRDARQRMDAAAQETARSAVTDLWSRWEEKDTLPPSTRRLVQRAHEVASQSAEETRETLLSLARQIEDLFTGTPLGPAQDKELGELEDQLLDCPQGSGRPR